VSEKAIFHKLSLRALHRWLTGLESAPFLGGVSVGPSRAEKNRKNYWMIEKLPKIESIPTNFVEKLLV
jgi:hypothetical protein